MNVEVPSAPPLLSLDVVAVNSENILPAFNEDSARDFLSVYPNNWPKGLVDMYVSSQRKLFKHFFIVDDSGSVCTAYFSLSVLCPFYEYLQIDE